MVQGVYYILYKPELVNFDQLLNNIQECLAQ